MIRCIFYLLSILFLQSCTVFKDAVENNNPLSKSNFSNINGLYKNQPEGSKELSHSRLAGPGCPAGSLWVNVHGCLSNERNGDTASAIVKVEFRNPRNIQLTLIKNDSIFSTKTLKGRIRNGYFYGRQHFVVYPFFPLVFGYNSYRYRIGNSQNGIMLHSKGSYWGFAFFGGGTGEGEFVTFYKKL